MAFGGTEGLAKSGAIEKRKEQKLARHFVRHKTLPCGFALPIGITC
jgi:hypothetical protein